MVAPGSSEAPSRLGPQSGLSTWVTSISTIEKSDWLSTVSVESPLSEELLQPAANTAAPSTAQREARMRRCVMAEGRATAVPPTCLEEPRGCAGGPRDHGFTRPKRHAPCAP